MVIGGFTLFWGKFAPKYHWVLVGVTFSIAQLLLIQVYSRIYKFMSWNVLDISQIKYFENCKNYNYKFWPLFK